MSAFGGKADIADWLADVPKADILGGLCLSRLLPRLELPFEHCDPVAQLDGFEFRVHGGGETGKAGKHRPFVFIEISACGMRTIERQGKTADGIRCRHRENWPP